MTILKPWPEHQKPRQDRIASAPYNFVPLPEKIISAIDADQELPGHDSYDRELHSGYFDVTLTTCSPLYIRGPMSVNAFQSEEQDKQGKHTSEFFYTSDPHTPVIPASSLRGMLRSLLEIASYSKIKWVSEKQLFFRTVDNTAVGKAYNKRMRDNVETGFLTREGNAYFITICSMVRIKRSIISNPLYNGTAPNETPRWQGQPRQYAPIWITRTNVAGKPCLVEEFSYQKRDDMVEGRLVITGNIPGKKKEFVFLLPDDSAEKIPVSDEIASRFHDEDQLTQWQEKAFPIDQPTSDYRKRNGMLGMKPRGYGDPIFFLREEGKLTFIGRAYMFRLPYERSPFDLVDPALRHSSQIDYAEALFGFARTRQELEELAEMGASVPLQGDKRRAYASRVIVTDGTLQSDPTKNIWLAEGFDKEITPRILATPKPTAFQQYLTQQNPGDKGRLQHYDSNATTDRPQTTIRGHKLYWHQGLATNQGLNPEQVRAAIEEHGSVPPEDTQHTRIKPLRPGVKFSFRVHFENLSERELGALCWTLHPKDHDQPRRRYCHHLGMGKPLGMGAVELRAHLHLINRTLRYETLFSGDDWQLGESPMNDPSPANIPPVTGVREPSPGEDLSVPEVLAQLTQPFEAHLLSELKPNPPCTRLSGMLRIAILLKLLEWPGYRAKEGGDLSLRDLAHPNTRYMTILPGNEYKDRPVLPDPTHFDEPYFKGKSRPQL